MNNLFLKKLSNIIVVLIVISVLASGACFTGAVQGKAGAQKKPLTMAHRGYSGKYPENTLQAFKGAMKNGFDGIECDVWENKAGVMFVHHDSTIKRMTGKNGYIWDLKLSKREKYPIINGTNIKKFKKNSVLIPTLTETLEVMSKYKGYLILHLKSTEGYKMTSKGVKKIVRFINRYKMKKRTIIMSGKQAISGFIKSGVKVALIVMSKDEKAFKKEIKWCKNNGVKMICAPGMKQLKLLGSEKKYANYLKKRGIKFGMYTTPNHNAYKTLTKLGAEFAMSNTYVA